MTETPQISPAVGEGMNDLPGPSRRELLLTVIVMAAVVAAGQLLLLAHG